MQGKRKDQVEGSAFFVGLSVAIIISLILWIAIIKWLNN